MQGTIVGGCVQKIVISINKLTVRETYYIDKESGGSDAGA